MNQIRRGLDAEPGPPECTPLVVAVDRSGARIQLAERGGEGRLQTVSSTATAASLLASWTNSGLDDFDWRREPTAVAEPAPKVESDRWWVSGLATIGEGGVAGGGVDGAWELASTAWRWGPAARFQVDGQPSNLERSGATSVASSVGLFVADTWSWSAVRMMPRLTVSPTHRYIRPSATVGPIPCAPSMPCSVDSPAQTTPAPAYHALTVWTDARLDVDFPIGHGVAFGVALALGMTPGFFTIGEPAVPPASDPRDLVRTLPVLPRWRLSGQLGLRWGDS